MPSPTSVRRAARFAVISFAASLMLPWLNMRHVLPDADCVGPVVAGHPVEQVEAVWPPVADEHCPVCHLLRAVGGAHAPAGHAATGPLVSVAAEPGAAQGWVRSEPVSAIPSRAPPARA